MIFLPTITCHDFIMSQSMDSNIFVVSMRIFVRADLNRIQAMAPRLAPLLGVYFLWGYISLKKWTYTPLLRHSASPNKGTCLFIYSIEVPFALYGPHLRCNKPVKNNFGRAIVGKFAVSAKYHIADMSARFYKI